MRVRWTTLAADDLNRIREYIKKDNPSAAARVSRLLLDSIVNLSDFPLAGRRGRIEGTRELVFSGLPYVVVYRIRTDAVEILRIYHGAQSWP